MLRTDHLQLAYTLSFETAFHCGSGLPRGLVDRAVRRDAEGYLVVPGSTLKGSLREQCERLATLFNLAPRPTHAGQKDATVVSRDFQSPDLVGRLFGTQVFPGTLYFDDAVLDDASLSFFNRSGRDAGLLSMQTFERTQVSLSRLTGAARPGLLFSSEYGIPDLGFRGEIEGTVTGFPIDEAEENPTYSMLLLIAGVLALDRIGGGKSRGSGRCRLEVQELKVNGANLAPSTLLDQLGDLEYANYVAGVDG